MTRSGPTGCLRNSLTAVLLILISCLTVAWPVGAAAPARRAVLILLDGVGIRDLADTSLPNFRKLLVRRGAIATLNTRTAGQYLPENGYVSLGAGTRALGSPTSGLVLGVGEPFAGEPAGAIFRRNTGYAAPPGALVCLDLPHLLAANAAVDHDVQIGALGEALRQGGKKVALLGGVDLGATPSRLAGTVAMDGRGIIPLGNVGPELALADPGFPTGQRTAYARLLEEFRRFYGQADLVVIETGDTARLNLTADWHTPEQNVRMRRRALGWFDAFLGRLASELDWSRTLVLVAAPGPSTAAGAAGDSLTFVAAFGPGTRQGGLLESPTTRRPGLVAEADVAATLLAWLDVPALPAMVGRPMVSRPFAEPLPALVAFTQRAAATYQERPPVLKGYVILQIIFILGTLAALFLAPRLPRGVAGVLQYALAGLTAVPLALLALPLVAVGSLLSDLVIILGLTAGLVLLVRLAGRSVRATFTLIYLATMLALLADTALGARLGRASILGYDPISGARYYGLGNEYMGVLLGAAIAGLAALLDLRPGLRQNWRWLILMPLAVVAAVTGLTSLGANFGGFLAAVATLLTAWVVFRERRFALRTAALLAGVGVAAVGGIVLVDALRPGSATSHVGVLVKEIANYGPGALFAVVTRKLAMNFRLMRYTPWADGLVTFIFGLGILLYRPVGVLRQIVKDNPAFIKGFWAALVGTAVAFLANDSGVVAAATFMLFPTAYLLSLALSVTLP
ncbi:MAG: hypothetical protein ACM3RP_02270 [Chitinophagales bacterium]